MMAAALPPLTAVASRILIVDDDPSMGETLALVLNRRGFEASSCLSGREALALLDTRDFDAIVTDLNMDEMNGIALCERIAVLRPGLPVIVMTGFGAAESRTQALGASTYGFLTKPVDVNVLQTTLEKAVSSR